MTITALENQQQTPNNPHLIASGIGAISAAVPLELCGALINAKLSRSMTPIGLFQHDAWDELQALSKGRPL